MKLWDELNAEIVSCEKCPRLVAYRRKVAEEKKRQFRHWDYWGKPITGFGDLRAKILLVGLAPAAHGGNRTGRIFTGDSSAQTLMQALHAVGLASQPFSLHRDDGLKLSGVYLTAVCRCAPPENKPTPEEISNCLPYLVRELELLREAKVVVALGHIAFDGTLKALEELTRQRDIEWRTPKPRLKFAHGAHHEIPDPRGGILQLLASYHPSRQNTQTGRLTIQMLVDVLSRAKALADLHESVHKIDAQR
jgi:uracil-DNA glycosylase family 4